MWRLYLLVAENLDLILSLTGACLAYLLNFDQKSLPGFTWINKALQRWRAFRERHKRFSLYLTLTLTVLSAVSFVPLILKYWPEVNRWWVQSRNDHSHLASWLLFIFAISIAGALFGLRRKAIKAYAFLEILVGIGVVAITAFDGGAAIMAMSAKMAGSVYAIIRGLVNITEAQDRSPAQPDGNPAAIFL